MTRAIAIISCLIAALFLVPVRGECNEISECESDTEIECCVVVYDISRYEVSEESPKSVLSYGIIPHKEFATVNLSGHLFRLPLRILHCVFRE